MPMAERPWEYWKPQSGREYTIVIGSDRIILLAFTIQGKTYIRSFISGIITLWNLQDELLTMFNRWI